MLNFHAIGEGRAFIWLHGLLGSGLSLKHISSALPGRHYLLDARNHGGSFHAKGMDYQSLTTDVKAFMDHHHLKSANIIGHSMGGKTAMALSLFHPEYVNKVCVLDAVPVNVKFANRKHFSQFERFLEFMKSTDLNSRSIKEIEDECSELFENKRYVKLLMSNITKVGAEYKLKVNAENLAEGFTDILDWKIGEKQFEDEIFVVIGGRSPSTAQSPLIKGPEELENLYRLNFPKVKFHIIKDSGHYIHLEKPSALKKVLQEYFLSQ